MYMYIIHTGVGGAVQYRINVLMIVGLRHMMCQLGSLTKASRCVVSLVLLIISIRAMRQNRLVMK